MNTKPIRAAGVGIALLSLTSCVGAEKSMDDSTLSDDAALKAVLMNSFTGNEIAPLTRLDQTEAQKACSEAKGQPLDPALKAKFEQKAMAEIKYPEDGNFLGDWKNGQKLAERGRGLTWRDKPGSQNYGNCYACHQLETEQVSYGNLGPSLNNYGKLRGNSEAMLRYTWGRIYNAHAFNACNAMPRFGAAGILSEAELKDLMALLHDPASPVNE